MSAAEHLNIVGPYAEAAHTYVGLGYSPIPVTGKDLPVAGVSGWNGAYVKAGNVDRLIKEHGDKNIALRLPGDLIGVDVDVYHGGGDTLAALEAELGALPPGVMSTSRCDGSGIRLLRRPVGWHLAGVMGAGIEVVQAHHRYVMCAPSIHPKILLPYRWVDTETGDETDLPTVDDHPALPWAWLEKFRVFKTAGSDPATPERAREFIAEHINATWPEALKGPMARLAAVKVGGRHDALVTIACWALREAAAGLYTAEDAVAMLRKWWDGAVKDDLGRGESGEFGSAILWAIAQADSDPERINTIREKAAGTSDTTFDENLADDTPEDEPPKDEKPAAEPAGKPRMSTATVLVGMADDRYRCTLDDTGRPHAVPLDGPSIACTLPSLRPELAQLYYATTGKAAGRAALVDALAVLEGRAHQAGRESLALRVARLPNGGIALDLGRGDGHAVIVEPGNGWRIVDQAPVVFRRTELTSALPEPEPGGTLDDLAELVNVTEADWPVLIAWMIACLLPDIPRPLVLLDGEQGTGKSTTAKTLTNTIDPSPAPLRSSPRDLEAWILAAAGSQVVALDNVSTIPEWLSDALCRAATGDALVRRALYTDGALAVTSFRRSILLTSIDAGALRGDLADRLLRVEVERIEPNQRRTDTELAAAFTARHPRILGALLDVAAGVLGELPHVHLDDPPRMADFAHILAALDSWGGLNALERYREIIEDVAGDVVAGDPLAQALMTITAAHTWSGTATDLLHAVEPYRPDRGPWPKTPKTLAGALRRLAPALRSVDVEVEMHRSNGIKVITIRRTA